MNATLRNVGALAAVTAGCAWPIASAQAQAYVGDAQLDGTYRAPVYVVPRTSVITTTTYDDPRVYTYTTPDAYATTTQGAYDTAATADEPRAYSEYAPVISSTPVVSRVSAPREQCWTETVTTQEARRVAGITLGAFDTSTNVLVPVTRDVQQCRTIEQVAEVVQGYDVRYRYRGHEYVTRTATDPGSRIRVDVSVAASPQ